MRESKGNIEIKSKFVGLPVATAIFGEEARVCAFLLRGEHHLHEQSRLCGDRAGRHGALCGGKGACFSAKDILKKIFAAHDRGPRRISPRDAECPAARVPFFRAFVHRGCDFSARADVRGHDPSAHGDFPYQEIR